VNITRGGYKMHANTDEDGFVKKMAYTPGNVHDSKEFDKLLHFASSFHMFVTHNIDMYTYTLTKYTHAHI
jgi:hypothetical protein